MSIRILTALAVTAFAASEASAQNRSINRGGTITTFSVGVGGGGFAPAPIWGGPVVHPGFGWGGGPVWGGGWGGGWGGPAFVNPGFGGFRNYTYHVPGWGNYVVPGPYGHPGFGGFGPGWGGGGVGVGFSRTWIR